MKKQIVNYQEKWKEQKIKVADLILDTKNIRLGSEYGTQDEVINDLFVNEDAMVILESISQNGYFPDEPPVVVKEKGQLIVIDGNRRVVSLKALISPEIAPAKYVSRIKKIMSNRLPIEQVTVHVATSRDEAMEYLAAKHTKNTRKAWSALRRAYFYYAQKENGQSVEKLIERYKGVDIPEYIRMHEMHNVAVSLKNIPEDVRKKISNKGTFKISTLARFYSDKYVQGKLGIEFNKKTGEAAVPDTSDFDRVYSKVINDIASGIATSRKELSKEKDRKIYIDSIINEILDGKELKKGAKKSAFSFAPPRAPLRVQRGLIQKTFEDTFSTPGIGRVLWELQTINYASYPMASTDLLRTFLERVLRKYLEETRNLPKPKKGRSFIQLGDIMKKMRSVVVATGNTRVIQVIDSIEKDRWYLDSINHNPDVIAFEHSVKDAWDQMHPLIKFVFDDYKKRNPNP